MNTFFKNKYILLFFACSLFIFVGLANDGTPPPPNPKGPDLLPIEGGIFVMSIIAVVYGVFKKNR